MSTVDGLPAHVLLVHAVVVLVPLTALLVLLVAFWPAARRRLVWPTAVLAVLTLVAVPLTTEAGEWLERRVARTELVRTHTELGDSMLPWAIGLTVIALVLLGRHLLGTRSVAEPGGRAAGRQRGGAVATAVVGVLAVVVAVGSTVTVYRIGESGARASWTGQFSQQAQLPPAGERPTGDG